MKRFLAVFAFFSWTTSLILFGAASYFTLYRPNQLLPSTEAPATQILSQAQPFINPSGQVKGVETFIESEDARPTIIARFLDRYNSPLTPHEYWGETFVEIADRYQIDFRLLPAIAMQESNLCKAIPEGSFNCLGFGIHERGTLTFESFEANFERAAKELRANYINQGRITPEMIMKKYTPSSNGSWADSVNQWMAEMRYDDRQKGRDADESANVLEFATISTPNPIPSAEPTEPITKP